MRYVWVALLLSGCTTYHATLQNADRDVVECSAQGHGFIMGVMAQERYKACVKDAQARGYQIKSTN